jgi:tetratricopeptide (TPR) repeat protein
MSKSRDGVREQPGTIRAALANGERLLKAQPAAAALQARTILRSDDHNAAAYRLLSRALAALGETGQAQAAMAEAIRLSAEDPALQSVLELLRNGAAKEALTQVKKQHTRSPHDPVVALLLGEALLQIDDWASAAVAFEKAIAIAPGYAQAHLGLARSHHLGFDLAPALHALEPLVGSDAPASAILFKATLMSEAGDHAAAEDIIRQILASSPYSAVLHLALADNLRTQGRPLEAAEAYRTAIKLDENSGRAWWGLVNVGGESLTDLEMSRLRTVAQSSPDRSERSYAGFAAAMLARNSANPLEEMKWLEAANQARRADFNYDEGVFDQRMRAVFQDAATERFFERRAHWGDPDPAPVFIVGMPRSGSTLLERMLGAHSQIEACGELPLIPALMREAGVAVGVDPLTDLAGLLKRLTKRQCRELGSEYLRRSRVRRRTAKPRFIDKLPHNWADLAFIRLILPAAALIDQRRHPLDCIVSNYRTAFVPGHPASYDLLEMAGYYATYSEAMDHFERACPGGLQRVIYEDLIADPRAQLTRLLGRLGLQFEEACLTFNRETGPVATASAEQVRREINRSGIGIWQRFSPWLDGVRNRLGRSQQSPT